MNNIIYIGMDVHTTSFSFCSLFAPDPTNTFYPQKTAPKYTAVLKYIKAAKQYVKDTYDVDAKVICAYEAGCLGYSLQRQLSAHQVECKIIAPSSLPKRKKNQRKNDTIDAANLCLLLAMNKVSYVHVPTDLDESINDYLSMRDDAIKEMKRTKQHIIALCHRYGKHYDTNKSTWTQTHMKWIMDLDFKNPITNETMQEYLLTLQQQREKIDRYNKRIEELAYTPEYEEQTKKLMCFPGIREITAMNLLVKVGDFNRFSNALHFASYLGLIPGEDSSGLKTRRTGITKSGNRTLRMLLIESTTSYPRWKAGMKSRIIAKKQKGADPKLIAYIDKASKRLHTKYWKVESHGSKSVAKVAIARELACFVWGAMTGRTEIGEAIN